MTAAEMEARLRGALERHAGVRFAILFGSAATRGPDAACDVDVAVSFDAPPSWMDLGSLAIDLERAVGKTVDLVDIDEATTLLRWEVVRTGRTIVAADPAGLLGFRARVPIEYADLRPYLDREAEGLRRALGVA